MGASSKGSARLVTSTIVVTLTDPEPSSSSKEETTEPSGSPDFSTSVPSINPSSLPVALPANIPSFTTPPPSSKVSSTPIFILSAAPSVVTATQTVIVFPSTNSTLSQGAQAQAQTHGLSRQNIIVISSSVGGGVLIALLAGIIFCFIRRRKRSARNREYNTTYGSQPADPFNSSFKGANMSQEKFITTHHDYSMSGSPHYEPDHRNSLYYDGYAHNVVGQRYAPVPPLGQDRVVIAPQWSSGHSKAPLLPRNTRMEASMDSEMDEHRRLNPRSTRADETPPPSASPLSAGYRSGHEGGDIYSPDEYGEYVPYGYGYTSGPSMPSMVRPAVSLADATPARIQVPGPSVRPPDVAPLSKMVTQTQQSASPPKSQQQNATVEASSSFEYPSWLRMGLKSGAITSVSSMSAVPAALPPSAVPSTLGTNKKSAIALPPIMIPEYTPRSRAATVSIPSSRESSRSPAQRPRPTIPLPAPPPSAPIAPPSVYPMPPAQVETSTTRASIVTRKSTKGRRSLKRSKGSYQALNSDGTNPIARTGVEATKRPDSPGAYSDGGDSASMYSQVSASMYSQASASISAHANMHNGAGLELSDSTILAFPLIMRQNPPPLPPVRPTRGPSSPSLSPSMSLPNDVFGTGVARPRRDVRAAVDLEGEVDDTITMQVAGLIQSRVRHMRSVAALDRSGSVVSHIERAGSIKPAFGSRAAEDDGVGPAGGRGEGMTRPLRINASKAAGAKVRMARMKRDGAAMDAGPVRPLQDGTNTK